jgi:hypothetical protein
MGRLHSIISGITVVLAPENVSESHRFDELSGLDKKASAVGVPGIGHGKLQGKSGFKVSKFQGFKISRFQLFQGLCSEPQICGWDLCELIVNLPAGG